MSALREAAQQALEALEFMADQWGFTNKANRPERWRAIDALRAALAQEETIIRGLHSISNEDNGVLTLCFADESSAEAFMVSHTGDADEALIQRAALAQQEQEPCKRHNPCERLPDGYCARCHSEMYP